MRQIDAARVVAEMMHVEHHAQRGGTVSLFPYPPMNVARVSVDPKDPVTVDSCSSPDQALALLPRISLEAHHGVVGLAPIETVRTTDQRIPVAFPAPIVLVAKAAPDG